MAAPTQPEPALDAALKRLARIDPDLRRAVKLCGPLPDRRRPPGYATLLQAIVGQQVSVAAAAAIWQRVNEAGAHDPARLRAMDDDALKACGLSRPKMRYARALAEAVAAGTLDFDALHAHDDATAIAALSALPGIGRWTAEIYLLFALGRTDVWPAQDLALQAAVQHLKGMRSRPDVKRMDRLAEPWRPHRGVAARLLWRYYGLTKQKAMP